MSQKNAKLEELDGLLDGLQEKTPPPGPLPTASTQTAGTTPPPLIRKQITPSDYKGRTRFDDLFITDAEPTSAVRAGPEEKVEYFREKLRRAEAQTARVREAWQIREAELDAVETLLTSERRRADEAAAGLQQLQAFLDKKKLEFETYGQKVSQVVAEKEAVAAALKAEVDTLRDRAAHESQNDDLAKRLEAAQEKLVERDAKIAELKTGLSHATNSATEAMAMQAEAEESAMARDATIDKLKAALKQRTDEMSDLMNRLSETEETLAQARAQAAVELSQEESNRDAALSTLREELRRYEAKLTKAQSGAQKAQERCAELEAALEQARTAGGSDAGGGVHLNKLRKVVDLAEVLLSDLEAAQLPTTEDSGAKEIFQRLHRALEIARREAEAI